MKKYGFILLTRHSDEELTNYLQRKAEAGWWLYKVSGNRFYFDKKPYEGKRICAYTFSSVDPDTPTELQLSRLLPSLRRKGWNLICISGPENMFDSRRHAFLYEEQAGSVVPVCEQFEIVDANKRKIRKSISNFLLCFLFLLFLLIVLKSDLMSITSNLGYLFFIVLLILSLFAGLCLSLASLVFSYCDRQKSIASHYRLVDYSTRFLHFVLVIAILLFLIDGIW